MAGAVAFSQRPFPWLRALPCSAVATWTGDLPAQSGASPKALRRGVTGELPSRHQ
jgi:hypothetical protein